MTPFDGKPDDSEARTAGAGSRLTDGRSHPKRYDPFGIDWAADRYARQSIYERAAGLGDCTMERGAFFRTANGWERKADDA